MEPPTVAPITYRRNNLGPPGSAESLLGLRTGNRLRRSKFPPAGGRTRPRRFLQWKRHGHLGVGRPPSSPPPLCVVTRRPGRPALRRSALA
jgi:hypothetical protein